MLETKRGQSRYVKLKFGYDYSAGEAAMTGVGFASLRHTSTAFELMSSTTGRLEIQDMHRA